MKLKCKNFIINFFFLKIKIFLSDRKANVGTIECRMCQETYSTAIHCKILFHFFIIIIILFLDLTEPIDVYNSWIDACEEQNRD